MTRLVRVCILGEQLPLCDLELCHNTCTLIWGALCTHTPQTCTPSRHSTHSPTLSPLHTYHTPHSPRSTDGGSTPAVLPSSTSLLRRLVNTFTPSKRTRTTLPTEGGETRKAEATTPFRASAASAQRRGAGSTGRRKRNFQGEVCFPVAQWAHQACILNELPLCVE